jgi:hypothetical protein
MRLGMRLKNFAVRLLLAVLTVAFWIFIIAALFHTKESR